VTCSRLQDFLVNAASRRPHKAALVHGAHRLTYRDLAGRAHQLAWALRRRGVSPGDRVLLFCDNTLEAAASVWGILAASGVVVPISPLTRTDKLAWLLEHSGASALITERRLAPVFAPAIGRAPDLRTVLVSDPGGDPATAGQTDWASALAVETTDAPVLTSGETDLAAMIYTSGSTGRPKGVMLTHRNMVCAAESICQYLTLGDDDVVHGIMPLSFDYGLYQLLLSVRQGARLVLAPPFTLPGQVLKQAAAERVTFFPGVPTVFALLDELRGRTPWDLSSVRAVTSTAAALTGRHITTIRRVFPNARIFSMYGLTECKRCTYLPPEDLDRKPGSVGIAIPNTELWLIDEFEQRLGAHQVGQLVIRGPTVMRGYWRDPLETSRRLRPGPTPGEVVLYTGDLCRLDEDGYLYFVGRMDDIIKSRGEKVPPQEVEMVLSAIPGVRESAVIGVDDERLGQAVQAFVVLEAAAAVSEADLRRECRDKLEAFMVPTIIVIVPSLPRGANGKIDKLALRRPIERTTERLPDDAAQQAVFGEERVVRTGKVP